MLVESHTGLHLMDPYQKRKKFQPHKYMREIFCVFQWITQEVQEYFQFPCGKLRIDLEKEGLIGKIRLES